MSSYYIFHYGIPCIRSISILLNNLYYVYQNIIKGYNSDIIVFYKNNPTPYLLSYVNNSNNPVIVWKYNRYTHLFYSYNCFIKDYKKLPILSASIIDDNSNVLYNLDDFLDSIKVDASSCNYPSLQQIIDVWSYSTGIVLDRTKNYKLEYIDTNVNINSKNIFTEDFNFVKKE